MKYSLAKKKTPGKMDILFFFLLRYCVKLTEKKNPWKNPLCALFTLCVYRDTSTCWIDGIGECSSKRGWPTTASQASQPLYYYSTAASFWRGGALVQIEVLLLLYAVGANNISSRRLDPSFFRNVQAGC
jgi:hypothetical protein